MARKRDYKDTAKIIKDLEFKINMMKNEMEKLKKQKEGAEMVIRNLEKRLSQYEGHARLRTGICKDCGTKGKFNQEEVENSQNVKCPKCAGNTWMF